MHTFVELAYVPGMEDRYVSPPPRLFRRKFSHSLIYGYRGGPRLSTSRVLLVVRDILLLRFYIYIFGWKEDIFGSRGLF